MPVARIVTCHVASDSPELKDLFEQLGAAGYEVEVVSPGSAGAADLVIELDQVPLSEVLDTALKLSREANADMYIAPGLFRVEAMPEAVHDSAGEQAPSLQEHEQAADVHSDAERGSVIGARLEEVSAALADGRGGIRDTVTGMRARVAGIWAQFMQRRAAAAQERRLQRQCREWEGEQRRRQHELQLQRRAEEQRQALAERERLAAEQERVVREQVAREAALRAERERSEREAMAMEAARRAELARAEEQERQRRAAIEAERLRALRQQEAERVAAVEAERIRARSQQQAQPVAFSAASSAPAPLEATRAASPQVDATPRPAVRPRLVRPSLRRTTSRDQQWQQAAFIASLATLAAMIGFAIAGTRPTAPLPASLMQNPAQQQVPFGPAKIVPATAAKPATTRTAAPVKPTTTKPSPTKPAPQRRARGASAERDLVADDEVIVRHAPKPQAQRGQTTAGVRHYSDEN